MKSLSNGLFCLAATSLTYLLVCPAAEAQLLTAPAYQHPTFVIPYAHHKPRMDGTIGEDEWKDAFSINALQTPGGQVSPRQSRWFVMWDEDNLYLAMRSPLRQGERLQQTLRDPNKDVNVVFDDAYEIWIDAQTKSPYGQPVFFQFLSNFSGARYDLLHEPAVGNMRLGWNSGWQPKNSLNAKGEWEMEVAVPRASLYRTTPFKEGETLRGLLARDYKRPWEQNSVEGISSFAVRDNYSAWKLSKTAPAVQLSSVADAKAGSFGLQLTASGSKRPLSWEFSDESGVKESGVLNGELNKPALTDVGTGRFRIRVLDGQNTVLDWSALRAFGNLKTIDLNTDAGQPFDDRGDVVNLSLQLNPVRDYLRISGDFINFDARKSIQSAKVEVTDAAGKVLAQQSLQLDALAYMKGVLRLPSLKAGNYNARLTAYDAAKKVVLTRERPFEKQDLSKFAWWNTPHGNIEKVIAPWTPVKYSSNSDSLSVWGRNIRMGRAGLPAQITAVGQPLLARPMQLVASGPDNKPLLPVKTGTKSLVSQKPHRVVTQYRDQLSPNLSVSSQVTTEFDGMVKIDLTLTPKVATKLGSLKMVVPLRPEIAEYLYGKGEGIRMGYDMKFLPKGTGRVWDSTKIDSQSMQVGSFIPYLWLGNSKAGLCWYADSDEGWSPNNRTPAVEIRRDTKNSVDVVFNFVSQSETLKSPRKITFAFQATPVKPMPPAWRMDSWWTGSTFRDYAQVEPKGGSLIFTSLPFPLDVEKSRAMVEAMHAGDNSFVFGVPGKYPSVAVPYFEHIRMGEGFAPDVQYFKEEWKTDVSEGFYYGKSLQDFMIHHLGEWAKSCQIDGFYIDNMHPLVDDNLDAGRGYRLPDGRVQPTYAMFETRRYFLRMRAVFQETRGKSKVVLHMTNNMIVPWVEAADIAYDGEDKVIYPNSGKDFMDEWSLERLRMDYPAQWGIPVNFMHEYQGNWEPHQMTKAMRAFTGMMLLHDALMSGNSNGLNQPAWIARERFGITDPSTQFFPYWQSAGAGVVSPTPKVLVSLWKRPGKLLLAVVNRGEATKASVTLDAKALGLGSADSWKVSDAEAGTSIEKSYAHGGTQDMAGAWNADSQQAVTRKGNVLTVPVERHDYRQIIVEAK